MMFKPGGKHIFYFIAVIAIFLFSCNRKVDPPYQFVDQDLRGKIVNQEWDFVDGVARVSTVSNDTVLIGLYNAKLEKDCSYAISEEGLTFFVPFFEGLYQLSGDWDSPQSVNFYRGITNLTAWRGAIEIISIDTVSNIINGRIDATVDDNSSVNGNFVVSLCK
ncbi:MAG: hypothetical protein K9H64_03910 [Bacteroidales bacterium]|nr:hypothetical protein [Bacteroidales bacterium]MCF8454978.1 hypothetical protein [Bacteroidales bacterium]